MGTWVEVSDVGGPFSFSYFAPSLYITSNLGWANRELMFDATLNPSLLRFPLTDLAITTLSDDYVKGPYNLVFDSDGIKYLVPQSVGRVLGRQSLYLWRVSSGIISEFRFVPNAPPVEEEPATTAKAVRILN